MKKKLLFVLMIVFAVAITMAGCDGLNFGKPGASPSASNAPSASVAPSPEVPAGDEQIRAIYELYSAECFANGQEPLTYEEWLNSIRGADGAPGVNGLSAYEIWLNNGHEGTEEDFLNWL